MTRLIGAMIPVRRENPTPLPRKLPKGVKLVFQEEPLGGFSTGRNPFKKNTVEWVAFERHREENWEPWVWSFSSFKAFLDFQEMKMQERG